MEQNPYAQGGYQAEIYTEPERTSLAAVFSLICSLVCCIPGLSVLGVVLGAIGVIGIGRSQGRVGGRGLAIAGIVIGVLVTVLWIGIVIGAGSVGNMLTTQGRTAGQVLSDLEAGNYTGARSVLAGSITTIADDDLEIFKDDYVADAGSFVSTPPDAWAYFSGFGQVAPLTQTFQGRNDIVPFPATFANGPGLILIVIDPSGQTTPAAGMDLPITDLIVVAPDGTSYTLSDYQTAATAPAPPATPDPDADPDADADGGADADLDAGEDAGASEESP